MILRLTKEMTARNSPNSHTRRFLLVVFAGLMTCCVAACSVTLKDAVVYHSLSYPGPSKESASAMPGTLMVYRFLFSPLLDLQYLVVDGAGGKNEALTYHRWSDNPANMITDLIERDIRNAGLFKETIGQFTNSPYRYALEGKILDMRGAVNEGKAKAILEVEIALVDFEAPRGEDQTLLKRRYRIETPCGKSEPPEIIAALNRGIGELSKRLRNDIRSHAATTGAKEEGDKVPPEPKKP
ncbi:MAG: ABC-type transport auxiliary lipoprotein family protein [Pseudomonadota bacterium]